ncbi:uncharacterized protein LOC141590182 [Silene latifolia]|uniref:uncharacterized protein LOC141590182 n=1 Tax=Silene latifolia TaxID=37657 RepID=UPI003D78461B
MVDVQIGQQFSSKIEFMDELGKLQKVTVVYDWLPLSVENVKGWDICCKCRKGEGGQKKVWKPKAKPNLTKVVTPNPKPAQKLVSPVVSTPCGSRTTLGIRLRGRFPLLCWRVTAMGINQGEGGPSFPRRFISKMLKHDNGEPRLFTLRGIRFMDALTLSIQKARTESMKLLTPEVSTDNGDFNSITEAKDRIGGADVSWAKMAPMRSKLVDCQLHEMKTSGSYYTWNNKHKDETKVYSRIDRVLMNEQWFQSFPEAVDTFLPEGLYDHYPCLINTYEIIVKRKAAFKYFNMWALSNDFDSAVNNSCNEEIRGTPMFRVVHKLNRLKPVLSHLNKDQFSDIENLTHVTELTLKHFQQKLIQEPLNDMVCKAERECAKDLRNLIKVRNSYLAQKAKASWIRDGDGNTSFFHSSIKRRRMKNRVYNVKDMEGNLCSKPEEIKEDFETYYKNLLGTSNPVQPVYKKVVKTGKVLTEAHQGNAFTTGKVLKEHNTTILTLIPKTELPDSVLKFRPIVCCNTVYKCLTKVMCTRLSSILPDIINPSQAAFIKNRDIMGNILICQDLIKLYKRKVCSPRIMMKIDLQKAYDSIEWSFLKEMLVALNFPNSSIDLIMNCVSTPSFSLALNGEVGDLHSVRLMLRAFGTFSISSGLKMNNGKSNFYSNGMSEDIYAIFILPKTVLNKIDAVCRAFLWHGQESKESPALVSWKQICIPRRKGGLGLKVLHQWNVALLGKYVWWIEMKTGHLWWRQSNSDYNVKLGYHWLIDDGPDVAWCLLCEDGEEDIDHLFF